MKSSSGFTWFEILLVLVVLLVLLALLFPAVSGPPPERGSSQARNDVVQIATALTAFETEYGYLPSKDPAVEDVGGPILQALMGLNDTLNPKRIVFLEVESARKNKGGLRDGVYVDPWGSPYKVKFDTDYDNRIQNAGPSQRKASGVMKKVAVWNDPSIHADEPSEARMKRRSVTSWD